MEKPNGGKEKKGEKYRDSILTSEEVIYEESTVPSLQIFFLIKVYLIQNLDF
jgi:hypothetical protein